jgi:hypothetical protein
MSLQEMPLVLQYNKRDLQQIVTVEALQKALNPSAVPYFEASARFGLGVFETLKGISRLALDAVRRKVTPEASPKQKPKRDPGLEVKTGVTWTKAAGKPESQTEPMRALQDVDFAEESTGKFSVRAVATKGVGAIHEELEKVRGGQVELEHSSRLEVPRALLEATSKLGIHLSFQGEDVALRDAATVVLQPDQPKGRIRLRLELEIEGTE